MALPALQALEECADWSKTVEPFIPQFYELPDKVLLVLQGSGSFRELYLATNPLISAFAMSLVISVVVLVVSEINRNYSQIDRLWSLLPTFYIAHFDLWARMAGVPSQRLDVALFFSTMWSIRLTYNYARKGGYNVGSEDYRWEILRQNIPKILFHLLNLTFISFIQSILLFLIAAPAYPLLLAVQFEPEVQFGDLAYAAGEIGLVAIEWFADQQQWDYQSAKQQYRASAKVPPGYARDEMDRGFVTRGLWAYSRHPNFAAEQAIWCVLYQWSCYATNVAYGWAGVGAGCLLALFQGSTWLTELITAGKYPDYKHYQSKVGMFVPMGFGYKPDSAPAKGPKVIRTSELAKRQQQKQKQK